MNYFFVFIVVCWGLLGCSSSGFRAPVSDLTLNASKTTANKTIVKKNTAIKNSKTAVSQNATKMRPSPGNLKSYRVKAGDTLYAIAWKMGVDVKTLAKRNNLKSPYTIYPSQLLSLTGKKQSKYRLPSKTIVKNNPSSRKVDNKLSIRCAVQSCVKNTNKKVVQKKTKAYSANKANEKVVLAEKATYKKTTAKKINSWRWPAKGNLTKSFSASQAGMKGISIANQRGTAIYATTAGQVVYAGSGLRGYGNLIIIKHDYDYLSAYAHNEELLVRENEQIKEGQKIAIMGDSGTDSVHLHFEIRYRGKSVDPLRYLAKR